MSKEKIYKLPGFKCPNPLCGAKNIAFASNKNIYNRSRVMLLEDATDNMCADYVVICPKCKSHLIIWDQSMVNMPMIIQN